MMMLGILLVIGLITFGVWYYLKTKHDDDWSWLFCHDLYFVSEHTNIGYTHYIMSKGANANDTST